MKNKLASLLISLGLALGASQVLASQVNITITDNATGANSFAGVGINPQAGEDNETEPGTVSSQTWDMEAFVLNGTTLYIVGGYNMEAGAAGSGGVVSGMLTPGDLFIKVGGGQPSGSPLVNPVGGTIANGYNYTYAVDLSLGGGNFGPTATAYTLSPTSVLNTVVYDQFGANPWKYNSGATGATLTGISYLPGQNNAQTSALTGSSFAGTYHNILAIDLSFLGSVAATTDVWFSYTMECGNDSLKGQYSGGFYQTPDSASSVLLIGLGLAAMGFFGLKSRR